MNPPLILKAIPVVSEGRLSLEEFTTATSLGRKTSADLARYLVKNGIGTIDSNYIEFESLDRMHAAILAIQIGADVEEIAKVLSWRDFEVLASKILDANGYTTYHGFRLRKPRVEIDVVGIRDQTALLIDCKHWKRGTPSQLKRFASMQIKRAEAFVRAKKAKIRFAVPTILTLHMESIAFADGVPVIPVVKFRSFLNEMHGYMGEIRRVVASMGHNQPTNHHAL